MENLDEQHAKVRGEVAQLRAQVRALRLVLMRAPAILAIALMAVGTVLPAWFYEVDDEVNAARVISLGFVAMSEPGDGFGVAAGIGFLGLLLVLVLLCGVLFSSVISGQGRAGHARVRGVIETLAVIGSVVATLFSLYAMASHESGVSGGAGPVVLLAGVILGVLVVRHRPWQDLWLDQPVRHPFRDSLP